MLKDNLNTIMIYIAATSEEELLQRSIITLNNKEKQSVKSIVT